MATAITDGIASAISAVGSVISAITSTTGAWSAVLPMVGLAVGFFVCRTGVRMLKSLIKGY